jgi:enoyl-CoA hydratase/carnithine racemase
MSDKRVFLTKHSPEYWRVTFNHPPLNIFGPKTIPQLNEIITAVESDEQLKVVVFDSAIDGFFLTHYDFLAKVEETTSLPPGPTGLQPLPDMLVRLSRAPVVSIASIRGRATGVGSELALACDMRFASREKAILSHFEVGAGVVPGGGPMARLPRLMGRGRALDASAPFEDQLMFVTRMRDTAFKRSLKKVPLGTVVKMDSAMGSFTLHKNSAKPAVFLAGGIGITPFSSIVRQADHDQAPHKLYLFYSNRRPE